MKRPFKQSIEAIEKDLYQLLQLQKGQNSEIDSFVEKESTFYFEFQKKLLNLVENKISIAFSEDHFAFNDLARIYNDDTGAIKYSSKKRNTLSGIFWHGRSFRDHTGLYFSISPHTKKDIHIYDNIISCDSKKIEPLQTYFFKNLKALAKKYDPEILHLLDFLIPLNEIISKIKYSGGEVQDFFQNEEYYSTFSIYDIMNKNKDIFSITLDVDISSSLEKMKTYLVKNNKMKKTL